MERADRTTAANPVIRESHALMNFPFAGADLSELRTWIRSQMEAFESEFGREVSCQVAVSRQVPLSARTKPTVRISIKPRSSDGIWQPITVETNRWESLKELLSAAFAMAKEAILAYLSAARPCEATVL